MPPHDTYIEAFLGGGAVLRHKRAAARNIGLDLDQSVIAGWRLELASSEAAGLDPALGAAAPFAKSGDARSQFSFECRDAIQFLRSYRWRGGELVYCDPPYLLSTRSSGRALYRHEMTDAQHVRLLRVLVGLPCAVMVSGYPSDLYGSALASWRKIEFQAMTRGGHTATEVLWSNFPPPVALHDYRYLGDGFRGRERIARQCRRWRRRLENMPLVQRRALLWAISEVEEKNTIDGCYGSGP